MFKVNNEDFETDINDLIVSFEHISHLFLVFLLLTLNWKMFAWAGSNRPLGLSIKWSILRIQQRIIQDFL